MQGVNIFSVCLDRNKDFQEVTLEKDGETVLRFAAAYGFRNIQNMVLKLKKGKFLYHFVEVLACPGGKNNCGSPVVLHMYLESQRKTALQAGTSFHSLLILFLILYNLTI